MSTRRRTPGETVTSQVLPQVDVRAHAHFRQRLRKHLTHTREILNGRDFLFAGPEEELQTDLKSLIAVEIQMRRSLHLNYARLDDYFLLRIIGSPAEQELIRTYFDEGKSAG